MLRPRMFFVLFAFGLVSILSSCASIDTTPFKQFKTGLENLRDGANAQAATDVQNARARFATWAKADKTRIPKLQLEFPLDSNFGYQYPDALGEPLFISLTNFQHGLKSLNRAMVTYATLLAGLADDDTLDAGQFDQLTKDLNGNASSAAKALKLDISSQKTAFLSTAAVTLFRAALEGQRRHNLQRAIEETQPQVDAYAQAMKLALTFLATGITADYVDQAKPLISTTDNVDELLELNQQTQATLDTLDALHASYDKLPAAHADLAEAVNKNPGVLTGIFSFANETARLNALYEELVATKPAATAD